ncbi:WXG100 family type VII secretion target [Clostridium sporogenes]|uniref:WXG100 family type VII secretion target n=1 Tax=Clostridium sporogenes TaxID=1509 RepID=UPI002903B61B|nr:WXG100 family type VII secretion target [Clostridium botulinum]MDU1420298.1 WXG100 family type VII secretion target [Clostridium botulinum]
MAETIRLNAEGLERASSGLKSGGNDLEHLINTLQNIVNSLPEAWEGEAAIAYAEQFASLRPGLDKTRQLVEDIAVQIDQTLRAAQELDSRIAAQLK